MSIEIVLLILESVLLLATITLLIYSIREGRQRRDLLMGVSKATKTLSLVEYFLAVIDSMTEAKKEVIGCVTGRRPTGDAMKRVKDIVSVIEKLTSRGVRVKYVLQKFQDRLYVGYLYTRAGAEVKYCSCSLIHSLRFVTIDGGLTVISIPEGVGENEPTRKGYQIPSEGLGTILKDHFYGCWSGDLPFVEYLAEVLEQTGAPIKQLALELGIEVKELERFLAKPSLQSHESQ